MKFPVEERYYKFSRFLKNKFGEKVYKISLDAGFTCPTRDGTLGEKGCLYCNNSSFSEPEKSSKSVNNQVQEGIERLKQRNINKYLAYFQNYTGTYAPIDKLERVYKEALNHPGIVGINIGTRPDCIDKNVLKLLQDINQDYYVTLEIGIESVYDKTLKWCNRGHNFQTTQKAIRKAKTSGLDVVGHYILGFPTENRQEMNESADILTQLPLDGLKLHHLHIVKNTSLAQRYRQDPFDLFTAQEWIDFIANYLEHLRSDIVIHRLKGDARQDTLIAPEWNKNKFQIIEGIQNILAKRDSWQGKKVV